MDARLKACERAIRTHQLREKAPAGETLPALLIRKGAMEPPQRITKTSRLRLVARRIYRWLTGPAC